MAHTLSSQALQGRATRPRESATRAPEEVMARGKGLRPPPSAAAAAVSQATAVSAGSSPGGSRRRPEAPR